jgi:hypothetical protein
MERRQSSECTQMFMRALFALCFIGGCAYWSLIVRTEKAEAIPQEQCMWDWVFDLTNSTNAYFVEDKLRADWCQIINSWGMDFTYFMFIYYFMYKGNDSVTSALSNMFYGPWKAIIQSKC